MGYGYSTVATKKFKKFRLPNYINYPKIHIKKINIIIFTS